MKLSTVFQSVILAAVAFCSGSLGLMVVDRSVPVASVRSLTRGSLKPGDTGTVYTVVDRDRICKTTLSEFVFDGQGARTSFEPRVYDGGVGPLGHDVYVTTFPVPYNAAPGEGRYRMIVTYVCNPLHEVWPIRVILPDLTFNIERP